MRRLLVTSGIVLLLASAASGQVSTGRVAGPLMNAPSPGTIMGYVYWDGNAVKHSPANDCGGLSVTVSAGGATLGTFSAGHFAYIPNAGAFGVCAYAINQMPVGQNLQVQANVTAPAAFSPAVVAGGASSLNIMGGTAPCNNLPPAVPSPADLSRNWWTCPNYAYNVNFVLAAATGLAGANRMAVGTVPPRAAQTANSGAQGTLLAPGGQQTLLGPQGNSPASSGNSGAAVAQRTASASGSPSGGAQAGSGTLGPSQTMSAPGPSPAAGALMQPNNVPAPGPTSSNSRHMPNANAVLTVCMEKAMQGQALWTAISAVDGKSAPQAPFGGGSAPGIPIIVGGVTGAVVTFTPGKHYIIQGCGFGSTPGQVFLRNDNLQIALYPQQWSDERIDAEVDPSASGVAQGVYLGVLTAGTTERAQGGGGVGEATAFGFYFDPNGSVQANVVNGNTASTGNSANSVNRFAATQLGPAQTALSPQTMAAGQTMSATGNSPGTVGRASSAAAATTASDAYVATSCAKDPTFRILGVIDNSTGVVTYEHSGQLNLSDQTWTDMLTQSRVFTIFGCSFGDASPTKGGSAASTPANPRPAVSAGATRVVLGSSFNGQAIELNLNTQSWSENSIVFAVPNWSSDAVDALVKPLLGIFLSDGHATAVFVVHLHP